MKILLSDIQGCLDVLVEMLRKKGIDAISTAHRDFYWTILEDDWLDFERTPKPVVGSLDDDIEHLLRITAGKSAPTLVDLERLAAVLKLAAEDQQGQLEE